MSHEPFVGRGRLLEDLREACQGDAAGASAALVLRGPRGVGRSALLERLGERFPRSSFLLLPFARHGGTPGQLALGLFRRAVERLGGAPVDPTLPAARWLDGLPPAARARVGAQSGELRVGAHPARALRSLVKGVEGLARGLETRVVVALDDPDVLRDLQGFPGIPRAGLGLHKFFVPSPWVRWILAPRYPGSCEALEDHPGLRFLEVPLLRRAEAYHLAALYLEAEYRPVPRALLWPLYELSGGRPGYLKALVLRLLQERRGRRGVPDEDAVLRAFLEECLDPVGRIGLACEGELSRAGGGVARALVDAVARRGPLGVESLSQLLGVGRTRTLEKVQELTSRGLLEPVEGRYEVGDPVMATRIRLLDHALGRSSDRDALLAVLRGPAGVSLGPDRRRRGWERRARGFLAAAGGRLVAAEAFGGAGTLALPSGGVAEAAVGCDARGEVDGYPGIVAADMLWNGRDRRWLVEVPDPSRPLAARDVERGARLRRFFQESFRRSIEHLWMLGPAGVSPEAREVALREGVLVSDAADLERLERSLLPRAA